VLRNTIRVVTFVHPDIYVYLEEGFVGPPDPWRLLKIDLLMRFAEEDCDSYLWKIGGYYVWYEWENGWTIDGSQPCEPEFVRGLIIAHDGHFQRMV